MHNDGLPKAKMYVQSKVIQKQMCYDTGNEVEVKLNVKLKKSKVARKTKTVWSEAKVRNEVEKYAPKNNIEVARTNGHQEETSKRSKLHIYPPPYSLRAISGVDNLCA